MCLLLFLLSGNKSEHDFGGHSYRGSDDIVDDLEIHTHTWKYGFISKITNFNEESDKYFKGKYINLKWKT